MTATMSPPGAAGTEPEAAPPKRRSGLKPLETVLVPAGEMGVLLGTVVWSAVRHPRGYWGEVRDQMFSMLKLCWIPMAISTVTFGFGAPGLQGGNIYNLFGIPERLGSFFIMASVREFAPWINAMVVAGVVGAAMTADLGARKIREEIDAMEVLGIDPIRDLIVPRVIAVTLMTGLLDLVALTFGVVGGYIAAVPILGASSGAFFSSFFANATVTDLWGSVLKTTIFGLVIAVVCCYKGLTVKGGPIGVGRAVNQAVVISFAAIFIINSLFTSILLGLNPDMQVYK
ncbi:phospholipid/cholesterol/gamma-HCH transport system permease protein [Nocardioides sp. J9]|uniref:MlaE family ABC transporter permease n=1 Tax=unclassified Nocardioides TaxID=2615069 RepID=UPI0004B28694|nr:MULTISPECIES: ABC transporter permease [unclassified Nocardioides]TWH00876.1 phospholipid/cholesterol/gamma-HCH transport system permease protein [Nocardioides sp. J9]